MIVNLTKNGWEIIYHRAHALLAAQIAGQWEDTAGEIPLVETITAISHHDDLEREWEGNHLTDFGAPLDFRLDTSFSIPKMQSHIADARYRSRWVALLVSMHTCYLNQCRREQSKEMAQFLDEQAEFQKQWRRSLGITKDLADKAYTFMRWCDRLSLILSERNLPDSERWVEITNGPDGSRYDVMQRADGTVCVMPWPFKNNEFTVYVDALYLTTMQFESNETFTNLLQEAPAKRVEWKFIK